MESGQSLRRWGARCAGVSLLFAAGCTQDPPPNFSFYEDRIAPIVGVGCAGQTSGCHVTGAGQSAVGNLDLSSYDALLRREDVLPPTGPYPVGQLLLKGGDSVQIPVQTFDAPDPKRPDERFVVVTTDIRHAAGSVLSQGSDGYAAIKRWIRDGYRRDGHVDGRIVGNRGTCRSGAGTHPDFDPAAAPPDGVSYERFVREVQPRLLTRCAGGSCHGSPFADLYLSCGKTEREARWNYFVAVAHVDSDVSLSELLRRPLSSQYGGTYHEGGNVIADTEDADYQLLRAWIADLVSRAPQLVAPKARDEGVRFFGNYVQPILVKKGCMLQNCHSVAMFHDLRLHGGSQGTFSRIAVERNYDMALRQLSLESGDPNLSRLIAKNLFPVEGAGIAHRGGALLEDFDHPATAADCSTFDVTRQPLADVPAYCVLAQWHRLERDRAIAKKAISDRASMGLLWVSRPLGVGDVRDFDTYRPGAELMRGELTFDGSGKPSLSAGVSLNAGCGLDPDKADIRGPAVSWDGTRIAFAARSSSDRPLAMYRANSDGTQCRPWTSLAAARQSQNGVLIHDFDPAFAPDGSLVFASTRGNLSDLGYAYSGPTRTRSQLAPNANLYVADRDGKVSRQLTFLTNQELMPSFMADGRLIFSVEKREPEFFQLAGRRQNLDGGDYHPLFAQRASVGFELATEIVELPTRDLAMVVAPFDAKDGAGAIAIVNRSLGVDPPPRDRGQGAELRSLRLPVSGALDGSRGVFRSPVAVPAGFIVASCDPDANDVRKGGFDFDLCALDPRTGAITRLGGAAGRADIEGTALVSRVDRGVFVSRLDEANGRTEVAPRAVDAQVHYSDFPMLATLLFSNTREGRPIDGNLRGFEVLESFPPPLSVTDFSKLDPDKVVRDRFGSVFVDYRSLGAVRTLADGSAAVALSGGHPVLLKLTGERGKPLRFAGGAPFEGEQVQREEGQFYPGERASQGFPRGLFNGMCAGCHGSITGYELDVAVDVDVLTRASEDLAHDAPPTDLRR